MAGPRGLTKPTSRIDSPFLAMPSIELRQIGDEVYSCRRVLSCPFVKPPRGPRMAASSQLTNKWVIMDPWWAVLKAHGVSTDFDLETLRGLRIKLVPEDSTTSSETIAQGCAALRDALELVFLQSIVDYTAFVQPLARQPQPYLRQTVSKEKLQSRTDGLPWHVDNGTLSPHQDPWEHTALSTLLAPQQLYERDPAFQAARKQLLSVEGAQEVYKKLHITIVVRCDECATALANAVHTAPPPIADYPFGRVDVQLKADTCTDFDQKLRDIVTIFSDKHERVRLKGIVIQANEKAVGSSLGDLLATCFQPEGPSSSQVLKGTTCAEIWLANVQGYRIPIQLCSAVMSARGLKSLCLDWTPNRRQLSTSWWKQMCFRRWIMLSLFSTLARHSIQKLELTNFVVHNADMDDVGALLLRTNHISAL